MILTVGNTKGGVGKSTLAIQIAIHRAIAGRDVWLIDGDRQGTSQIAISNRTETGKAPSIACAQYTEGPALRGQVAHQASKFQDIIIDVGGRDSGTLRAALLLTDVLLIPFNPRSADVWALDDIAGLVAEAHDIRDDLTVCAILSRADHSGRRTDNDAAAEAVERLPHLSYLNTPIANRQAFADSVGLGLCVKEMKRKDPKAIAELDALVDALY